MPSFKFLIFLSSLFVISLFSLPNGNEAAPTYNYHFCSPESPSDFTANSTYQSNLDIVLSSLYSNRTRATGFSNASAGQMSGLFLCRGDVNTTVCQDCVANATREIPRRCHLKLGAVIWYDECLLHYSVGSILATLNVAPSAYMRNKLSIQAERERFIGLLDNTTDSLATLASKSLSGKKFATKEDKFNSSQTLYSLVQCTPDLTVSDCNKCIGVAIGELTTCCEGQQGGRVLQPSCIIRYELYPFYNITAASLAFPPLPPPPLLLPPGEVIFSSTRKKSEGFFANKRRLAIVVVAILVTSFIILLFARWLIKRKRKGSKRRLAFNNDVTASSPFFQDSTMLDETERKPDVQFFDLSTIIAATDNFSPAKRLGQGGFGPVYKGELANGQEIAVKTLSRSSKQGTEEFKNEVKLIAKLQHRNLVRLFGCCIHKEEKMLVYEYMPNKSLDFFIFDEIRRKLIDWRQRFEIISGIARGVLYFHQDSRLKIIHRDLKASNVLLDAAMNPKVSDFGLARMFGDDQIEANTRKVVGTYGYMSPEYAMEGLYSIKSDVFSYGILTLEIISGKRNNYHHIGSPSLNLIGHVWDLWMEGKAMDIVDSLLGHKYPAQEVLRCIQIGLLCVQEQATDRPTMLEIVFMLGNEVIVPSPNKPAFINKPINSGQDSSGSKGTPASLNEMTITMPNGR